MTFIDDFRAAMKSHGLDCTGEIKADGGLHRFKAGDKDKDDSGWYVLHGPKNGDEFSAGAFGCWRRGVEEKWHSQSGKKLSGKELVEAQKRWREAAAQRQQEEVQRHDRMAVKAQSQIAALKPATEHFYLESKGVTAHGQILYTSDDPPDLLLPLQDATGKIWSYQTIDGVGDKLFMPGGRVQGCYFELSACKEGPLIVCEGYATGATIFEATGWAVVCAMNCGNMKSVCQDLRSRWPERTIVVAADNDRNTEGNPGLTKAREAANHCKGLIAVPQFPDNQPSGSDFNDLAAITSLDAVRSVFESVCSTGLGARMTLEALVNFKPEDDKSTILGQRYLCKGGSCVIVGSTSVGKSSLGLQMAVMFALGIQFFGLRPPRPMKSLFVQAENDLGDMAEIVQGILIGTGLIREDQPEANREIMHTLSRNLVIIRDQTHIGLNFSPFARSLIELHQPDFFWCDPLLSFYGDDINDQQAMTAFLRGQLNPISEQTGVCWMMLHHTGKPMKDAAKIQKSWSARDFAYMGIGSSELSNWARAIITLTPTAEDEFRLIFAKRGWRSGIVDDSGNPATEINVAHGGEFICWKRIPKPKEKDEMVAACTEFAKSVEGQPLKAVQIVRMAAKALKRGERTCWTLWDSGNGPLGTLFVNLGNGSWTYPAEDRTSHVKDD